MDNSRPKNFGPIQPFKIFQNFLLVKQTELLSHEHFIEMKRVDLPFFCEVMRVALAIGDSPLSFRISFLGCSLSLHKQLLYAPRQIQAKGGRRKYKGKEAESGLRCNTPSCSPQTTFNFI